MWCGTGREVRSRIRNESECSSGDDEYRIVVLGAPGVGKTGKNNVFDKFENIDSEASFLKLFDVYMNVQIEDAGPFEIKNLIKKCDGIVLIYSITDRESFRMISKIYFIIHEFRESSDTPLVLLGNKVDSSGCRMVTLTEGRELAFDISSSFYETSSRLEIEKTAPVFHDIVRQIRCVRSRKLSEEQSCGESITKVKGLIHRLSFRSRKKKLIKRKLSS